MNIDTLLAPAELSALDRRDLRGTACVVFDILRATSTFVTALHHGAREIIPVGEIAEAVARRQQQPEVLLAGERNGVRIRAAQRGDRQPGSPEQAGSLSEFSPVDFDFGNSPREFTPERVRGNTIVSTTTNGTRALRACAGAPMILAASFLNLSATAKHLIQSLPEQILLVCAGTGDGPALEDVLAAGALAERLAENSVPPSPALPMNRPGERRRLAGLADPQRPAGRRRSQADRSGSGTSIASLDNSWNLSPPEPSELVSLSDATEIARRCYVSARLDLPAALGGSRNARRLLSVPELRDDVAFCLQRDVFNLVAAMTADGSLRVV